MCEKNTSAHLTLRGSTVKKAARKALNRCEKECILLFMFSMHTIAADPRIWFTGAPVFIKVMEGKFCEHFQFERPISECFA